MVGTSALALALAGCPDGPTEIIDTPESGATILARVEVTHIEMVDRAPPPGRGDSPDAGWPTAGASVHWRAHLVNSSDKPVDLDVAWTVGDAVVEETLHQADPGASHVDFQRPWAGEREWLGVRLWPAGDPSTEPSPDDSLTVATDGLTIGFWVEQDLYDWMALGGGIPPFPSWARDQIRTWNGMLEDYASQVIPEGVLDRLRIEHVTVLGLDAPFPSRIETDLVWVFGRLGFQDPRFLDVNAAQVYWDQTIVLHEMIHQRGVKDLYAYEVLHIVDTISGGVEGTRLGIQILDPDGGVAVGSSRMPIIGSEGVHVFDDPPFERALMGVDYRAGARVTDVTVHGLNELHGLRTPRWEDVYEFGDTVIREGRNGFADGNDYLQHLPDTLVLTVTTGSVAHAGAVVDIFPDEGRHDYWDQYAPQPSWSGIADGDGRVRVPVSVLEPNPLPGLVSVPSTTIVRVVAPDGGWGYGFLPLYYLNQAWLEGERGSASLVVAIYAR